MKQQIHARWRLLRRELSDVDLLMMLGVAMVAFVVIELSGHLHVLGDLFSGGEEIYYCPATSSSFYGFFTSGYLSILTAVIAVLVGVNIVLVMRRSRRLRAAGATGIGSLLGLALGSCGVCGTGLLPLLGLSVGLGLPYGGVLLSLMSVAALLLALYWNTAPEVCRI